MKASIGERIKEMTSKHESQIQKLAWRQGGRSLSQREIYTGPYDRYHYRIHKVVKPTSWRR